MHIMVSQLMLAESKSFSHAAAGTQDSKALMGISSSVMGMLRNNMRILGLRTERGLKEGRLTSQCLELCLMDWGQTGITGTDSLVATDCYLWAYSLGGRNCCR
jgi:hypothetical protein